LLLLIFGLVVSIPLVIAGSQIIMNLIGRFPILILAGGGLLGFVAGEMFVEDSAVEPWIKGNAHAVVWVVPAAGVVLVIGIAKWLERRHAAGSR
jgi:predicted tellurium resistance membrane protein TerC